MMKLSRSRCLFISVLIAAGFLNLAEVVNGANEFRRCYNTSIEMHCFDAQYDNSSNQWLTTYFDNARQRCNKLNSTLIIIKDDETSNIVQNYMTDSDNPIKNQYVWTDAYRINDYKNSYRPRPTWYWLNSKLPNLTASEVGYDMYIWDGSYYTTALEFRSDNGKPQFYLTAKRPQNSYNYVCEYSVSRCSANASNVRQISDRCYISFSAPASWYEARNRCLKDGGNLASFANVTNINFTSWLGSVPWSVYWIGLRFSWYIWIDSGEEAGPQFTKWASNTGDWSPLCLIACGNCDPITIYSWSAKDCNTDSIYVVCHTVTPLPATTVATESPTTVPVTTTADMKTQTVTTQSNNPGSNSSGIGSSSGSSPIALGVGVGVGVGVPVIVAIIVIVICVLRRHQSKKSEASAVNQDDETLPTDVHAGTGEGVDSSHYATIRSVSPPTPSMVANESTHETEYATLGFIKPADSKNNNGHIPLDVL